MTDLTPYEIEIFQGINDSPTAPTPTSGQNISYNNSKHNALIAQLQIILDDLVSRIENLENNTTSNSGNNNGERVFSTTLPSGSGEVNLGLAQLGYLADWFIEGIDLGDDVNLNFGGQYEPQVANTVEETNGIRFYPNNPSEEVISGDEAYLVYQNLATEKTVTLTLNYQ